MVSQDLQKLPVIDFSMELEPGTMEWESVKALVKQAVEEYGCFEAIYTKIPLHLRNEIFGAIKELFELPLQIKSQKVSNEPFRGYIGQNPIAPLCESLRIQDSNVYEKVENLTKSLWPEGNQSVSNTMHSYSVQLSKLEEIVRKMILESLGVAKYIEEQMKSTDYVMRLLKYEGPQTTEAKVGLNSHTDLNLITILYQNQVEGLEVKSKDGEWIRVNLSPDKFFVMAGDSFHAWTNGRVRSAYHRVMMTGSETRYSTGVFSYIKEGYMVKAPEELVDEEHPLLFKPFTYTGYLNFVFTNPAQMRNGFALKAYCGV